MYDVAKLVHLHSNNLIVKRLVNDLNFIHLG